MVSLVTNLASESRQSSQSKEMERSRHLDEDHKTSNQICTLFARSMSDSGFESKESEKLLIRRGTEIQSSKLSLHQLRRNKFQERAAAKRRQRGSLSYFEIPELKQFRNFTNIFGTKKERRGSRQEKVTLQSIMKKNFASCETAE